MGMMIKVMMPVQTDWEKKSGNGCFVVGVGKETSKRSPVNSVDF